MLINLITEVGERIKIKVGGAGGKTRTRLLLLPSLCYCHIEQRRDCSAADESNGVGFT